MRPPLIIDRVDLRCIADPRDEHLRKRFANVEWRMSAMRMWLTVQQQTKAAELGNVTPIKGRK